MRARAVGATPTGSWVQLWEGKRQKMGLFTSFFSVIWFAIIILFSPPAAAVQTVPYKINFQGYLRDSSGQILADGDYNITFRLFDASTAGTQVWSEVRQETTRVTLTDGYFSVQLGDVATLSPTLFTGDPLYLEIELPTPATATCATNACASYTEGAMTPRQAIASAAFAFNADQLDGYDSSEFAIGSASNLFTGMNTFRTDNTAAFSIQNSNSDNLLVADTTNMNVIVGSPSGSVALSVNGILLSGNARGTKKVTLVPEYAGATFRGDGTDNNGSLSSDFCADWSGSAQVDPTACSLGFVRNYYQWTTDQTTADYDIYVYYRLPSDYDEDSMQNLAFLSQATVTGQNITLAMYDYDGNLCTTIGSHNEGSVPDWYTRTIASPLGTCTLLPDDYLVFKVQMTATQNEIVRAGDISFDYRSTF